MKRRNYKGRELPPLAVSDAAQAGRNCLPVPCSSRLRGWALQRKAGELWPRKSAFW